jgi:hypothetical protein
MKKKLLFLSLGALCAIGGIGATFAGISPASQVLFAEEADDGKCAEALNLIDLNVDLQNIVSSFRLPYLGQYNAKITWSSSNSSAVKITTDSAAGYVAKVTRGDANQSFVLTATASLTGSVSTSKDFAGVVLKKGSAQESDLALAMNEDFSEYETGIELSNYFRWQSSSSEMSNATPVEEVDGNINNMVSKKALAVQSVRTANSLSYTRSINVQTSALDAKNGQAVLEGYWLYSGETNGMAIELLNGNSAPVAGAMISSTGYSYFSNGSYASSTLSIPQEGVWQKFRLVFKPSVGRFFFKIYDYASSSWIELTSASSSYSTVSGVTSGNNGNVTGIRIAVAKGSKFGTTYLSDLKLDTLANLPEATPTNPNRTMGIGTISNYEPILFTEEGQTISGLNPAFEVHNRFSSSTILTKDMDYTVVSSSSPVEDGSQTYQYVFTLVSTGESKTTSQTVYFSKANSAVTLSEFKSSYLKSRIVKSGATSTTYGYLTLTGNVNRGDGTLYYVVLAKGSSEPTEAEILSGGTALTGYVTSGNSAIATHSFSLDTESISYSGEYDVYAFIANANGDSSLSSAKGISTVVNITTCQEFYNMSSSLDTLASTFRLMNDLDFSSYYWNYDVTQRSFTGVLDGQGHTVKNLSISNASTETSVKTAIFFNLNGTVKNITFENANIAGFNDVAVLGGNAYGCDIENVSFKDCAISQESTVSGGDGYMATMVGRCRGGSNTFKNIAIDDSVISAPQRSGLLVAGLDGSSNSCTVEAESIVASGSIKEDGGHAGLIGRNQGGTLNVTNALVSLDVLSSKKEVGGILGRNETGGFLKATNVYSDLKIREMTQPTYFGQTIGYDATTSGSAGKSFAYSLSGLSYLDNDYSDLGDSISPIKNAITAGHSVQIPASYTSKFYETQTFLRDLDTSLTFAYDATLEKPVLRLRSAADLQTQLTSSSFTAWSDQINLAAIEKCHYPLYKAEDVYQALSETEKAKIPAEALQKLTDGKKAYLAILDDLLAIGGGLDA